MALALKLIDMLSVCQPQKLRVYSTVRNANLETDFGSIRRVLIM